MMFKILFAILFTQSIENLSPIVWWTEQLVWLKNLIHKPSFLFYKKIKTEWFDLLFLQLLNNPKKTSTSG